ncbi:DUF2058 family protein [Salmonella enterica subsp. enterica serovar Kentucky]|nr:DUF2058 family protein [Salmonella enterica subsp. enterica serovar Kentucky]
MRIRHDHQFFIYHAQRDADSIVVNSALSQEEQDEDDPYADFKVPDDLMW